MAKTAENMSALGLDGHRLAGYPAGGFTTYTCTCLHESPDMAAHEAHAANES